MMVLIYPSGSAVPLFLLIQFTTGKFVCRNCLILFSFLSMSFLIKRFYSFRDLSTNYASERAINGLKESHMVTFTEPYMINWPDDLELQAENDEGGPP